MSYTPLTKRRKPANSRILWIALASIVVIFFITSQLNYRHAVANGLDPKNIKTQLLLIKQGDTGKDVAEILVEKNIIAKEWYLKKYLEDNNLEGKILAGRFELSPSFSIQVIAETITDSKKAKNYVTIPEGYSIRQIDNRLSEMQLSKKGDFIQTVKKFSRWSEYPFLPKQEIQGNLLPLEGFLFPDTYKVDPGNFSADNLIDLMLKNFQKKLPQDTATLLTQKNISLLDLITVASMLEKEVKHPEDLPIVAGIIWKRANSGWFLNIDATLLYDLNRQELTKADLEQDSPYNTYTRKGLTPGPIGNPGLKTIQAALNPEKTRHWFYLTDPKNGKAIYAETNNQQNRNRGMYLK